MTTTHTPIIAKAAAPAISPPSYLDADINGFPLQGAVVLRSALRAGSPVATSSAAPDLAVPFTLMDVTSAARTITFTAADVINAQGKILWFAALGIAANTATVVLPSAIMYRGTGAVATSAASNSTSNGFSLGLFFADSTHVYALAANNVTFT